MSRSRGKIVPLDNDFLKWHLQLMEERCTYVKAILNTHDYTLKESPLSFCKVTFFRVTHAALHKDQIERVYAQYFRCKITHIVEFIPFDEDYGIGVLLHNMSFGFEQYLESIRNKNSLFEDLTPYTNWKKDVYFMMTI